MIAHELLVNVLVSLVGVGLTPVVGLALVVGVAMVILLPLLASSTVPLTMIRMLLAIDRGWTASAASH